MPLRTGEREDDRRGGAHSEDKVRLYLLLGEGRPRTARPEQPTSAASHNLGTSRQSDGIGRGSARPSHEVAGVCGGLAGVCVRDRSCMWASHWLLSVLGTWQLASLSE